MFKVRLADVVERSSGGGTPARDVAAYWGGSIPWATVKDFKDGVRHLSGVQESITNLGLNSSSSNLIPAGTPIICMRMAVGRVATATMPVAINQDLRALFVRPAFDPDFVVWSLDGIRSQIENEAIGSTVKGISVDRLFSFEILDTSLAEQSKIAEVLSTVDRAIAQTEALIAKQQRIKTGLMQDLLTRGIDEHGQLRSEATHTFKDSPLGRIPAEWEVDSLASSFQSSPQNGLYKPESEYSATGIPIVRIDGFYHGGMIGAQVFRRLRVEKSELKSFGLEPGDILVNRVNTIDLVGKSALVGKLPEPIVFESNIMRLRLDKARMLPEFCIRVLTTPLARRHFSTAAKPAVAQASINQRDVGALVVALPNLREQRLIIEHLNLQTDASGICTEQLSKLRQLKTALMQDLLTGKVRVTPLLEPIGEAIA